MMADIAAAADERDGKRLRSSEPDLKVILGSGEEETVQWYHSQTLASKSKYIDTMLAVPMREREDRVISFPDIKPDVWAKMMKFLDDPIASREMNAKDAVEVVVFYDKYEFVDGRRLCLHIIVDYMSGKSIRNMEKTFSIDIDLIIDLVIAAHKANIEGLFNDGMRYIFTKMESMNTPYGRLMFTESQLEKLRPVLKYAKESGYEGYSPGYFLRKIGVICEDEDFPKKYISLVQHQDDQNLLRHCISHIEVFGTTCNADGCYVRCFGWNKYTPKVVFDEEGRERTRRWQWGDQQVSFRVQYWKPQHQDDNSIDCFEGWSIVRRSPPTGPFDEEGEVDLGNVIKRKCWIAPNSTNRKYPPLKGWVPCDPLARGNPTIKYVLNDAISGCSEGRYFN